MNNDWAAKVAEFTKANGYEVPKRLVTVMPDHTKVLRLRLMLEELGELACAMHENDVIEVADGITDLLYVVVGTAVEYGLGPVLNEMFDEVHRANMSKDYAAVADGRKGGIKGVNYRPPMFTDIIFRHYDPIDLEEK